MRKFPKGIIPKRFIGARYIQYRPIPGKIPLRLLIRVGIRLNPESDSTWTRFFYHGKWSWEAVRRAQKVYDRLDAGLRSCLVQEYCASGRTYYGNLNGGVETLARSQAVVPAFPRPVNGAEVKFPLRPSIPVQCFSGRWVLWSGNVPAEDDKPGWFKVRSACSKAVRNAESWN